MDQTTPSAATAVSAPQPVEAPTVCEAFQRLVALRPDRVALRSADDSVSLTWAELGQRVERLAGGLAAHGVRRGDTVAILMPNVPECHLVDYAALHVGGVPFTIYNTSSPEQIRHQLENADARLVVTQQAFLPRIREAVAGMGDQVRHIVVVDGAGGTTTLTEVEASAAPDFDFASTWQSVSPDDLATLIYTSGTTGPPKGAQLTHHNVMTQQRALHAAVPLPTDSLLSFLPMAHTGGRVSVHYMALVHGATITACPDILQVPALMNQVRPDAFFSVPRLWEKLQVGIEAMVQGIPDADQRAAARRAVEVGIRKTKAEDAGEDVPADEAAELASEHATGVELLRPILRRLGLDNIKSAFVGGAPCPQAVVQFFRAVGVPLLEAYGSTETGLTIFNRVERFKSGTAGLPLPGVEVCLLDDGELLIRSDLNMAGYRKQPEQTAAALDAEGWLHTGDIATIDDDGYVTIVDRKKEIIINSAGKNMSPANIESAIKGESSLIGQIVTIGDGRRYNTALITLDAEAAVTYAERLGAAGRTVAEIAAAPEIEKEIQAAVDRGNARLSKVEQIKKFRLLPVAWLPDSDELTPTLKLKRRPILRKYNDEIEQLYAE